MADALWQRVRRLAGEAERMREALDADAAPGDEDLARLARMRLRAARAADRARMADALADQLADVASARRTAARARGSSGPSQPGATGA